MARRTLADIQAEMRQRQRDLLQQYPNAQVTQTSPTGWSVRYGQPTTTATDATDSGAESTRQQQPSQPARNSWWEQRQAYYNQQQQPQQTTRAEQLAMEYQRAYDDARQANEQRYLDILQGYGDMRSDAQNYLQGMGQQREADIRSDWYGQEQGAMQDLTSRGLRGTTVAPTVSAQFNRGMQQDVGRLRDSLQQQYLGSTTPMDQSRLNFMERREDTYPDYNQMLQLQSGLGAAAAYGQSSPPQGAAGAIPPVGSLTAGSPSPAAPAFSNRPGMSTPVLKNYGVIGYGQPAGMQQQPDPDLLERARTVRRRRV